jgi:hypothetical protein
MAKPFCGRVVKAREGNALYLRKEANRFWQEALEGKKPKEVSEADPRVNTEPAVGTLGSVLNPEVEAPSHHKMEQNHTRVAALERAYGTDQEEQNLEGQTP